MIKHCSDQDWFVSFGIRLACSIGSYSNTLKYTLTVFTLKQRNKATEYEQPSTVEHFTIKHNQT